jgi:hypothetical protein
MASRVPAGLRVPLQTSENAGSVFHVLDALSVQGVDGHAHDCPTGTIERVDESIVFPSDVAVGIVEGRMTLRTADDVVIDVPYSGVLQLDAHPSVLFAGPDGDRTGRLFLTARFETLHPKYHWLSENTCLAFGTWKADRTGASGGRRVRAKLDVYAAATG